MIHVRIGADIQCNDGPGGALTQIVADRGSRRVTHLVVERKGFGKDERLVPVAQVAEASTKRLRLKCSVADLAAMSPLITTRFEPQDLGVYPMPGGSPYMPNGMSVMAVEEENLPDDARPVRQGMRVQAEDGAVGKVYELLVDPTSMEVTHIVLVDGRLWRKRAITLPLTAAYRVTRDTIYLKLDKQAVAALPSESLADLDQTALADQRADVSYRLAKLEQELTTAKPEDRSRLEIEVERLRVLQEALGAQLPGFD